MSADNANNPQPKTDAPILLTPATSRQQSRRVVVISDLHCGHRAGLTPPNYQYPKYPKSCAKDLIDEDRLNFGNQQRAMWRWFEAEIKRLQPIDVLIVNGDAIDGKGERSGGIEQLEPDMAKQADMAAEIINFINATKVVIVAGTPYHAGKAESFEAYIARETNTVKYGKHLFLDINGVVFDCKHKIGSSSIPHGRYTALARTALWNLVWSEENTPRADVFIRSHVHFFAQCGNNRFRAYITPALQGFGSRYGELECEGVVNIGFLSFDVTNKKECACHCHMYEHAGASVPLHTL